MFFFLSCLFLNTGSCDGQRVKVCIANPFFSYMNHLRYFYTRANLSNLMITLHYEVLHIQYLDSGRFVIINKKDHALLACEQAIGLGVWVFVGGGGGGGKRTKTNKNSNPEPESLLAG